MSLCIYAFLAVIYTYVIVVYTRISTIHLCATMSAHKPHATTKSALTAMRHMAERTDRCDGPRWALRHHNFGNAPASQRTPLKPPTDPSVRAAHPSASENNTLIRALQAICAPASQPCRVVQILVDDRAQRVHPSVWNHRHCNLTSIRLPAGNSSVPLHHAHDAHLLVFVGFDQARLMHVVRQLPFDDLLNIRACFVPDFPKMRALMLRKGLCEADRPAHWSIWLNDFELKRLLCAWRELAHPP